MYCWWKSKWEPYVNDCESQNALSSYVSACKLESTSLISEEHSCVVAATNSCTDALYSSCNDHLSINVDATTDFEGSTKNMQVCETSHQTIENISCTKMSSDCLPDSIRVLQMTSQSALSKSKTTTDHNVTDCDNSLSKSSANLELYISNDHIEIATVMTSVESQQFTSPHDLQKNDSTKSPLRNDIPVVDVEEECNRQPLKMLFKKTPNMKRQLLQNVNKEMYFDIVCQVRKRCFRITLT